jgi:hypothetical protein
LHIVYYIEWNKRDTRDLVRIVNKHDSRC